MIQSALPLVTVEICKPCFVIAAEPFQPLQI